MFKTKNDIPEATRVKAIELLNARLADCKDLQTQVKQAHWNVRGRISSACTCCSTRSTTTWRTTWTRSPSRGTAWRRGRGDGPDGGQAESLAEYPVSAADGCSHVEALSSALAAFGKSARTAISEADDLGDLDTADLFTEVSRGIDKWLWFVEAHIQAER